MTDTNWSPIPEPEDFSFDEVSREQIEVILRRYPPERKASAVISVMYTAGSNGAADGKRVGTTGRHG
jgi:nicotinamide mononucleotide (NMN) deamidase PncC